MFGQALERLHPEIAGASGKPDRQQVRDLVEIGDGYRATANVSRGRRDIIPVGLIRQASAPSAGDFVELSSR
jgi:hypothetical protein